MGERRGSNAFLFLNKHKNVTKSSHTGGEAPATTRQQWTTTQQQIHRNRSIACGDPSDIDVTLILHASPRPLPRRLPETSTRVPGQPRPQNGSKSNVSHKEINCKLVLSFFWKSTPPNQMSKRLSGFIWPHLASSGVIWPHLVWGVGFPEKRTDKFTFSFLCETFDLEPFWDLR